MVARRGLILPITFVMSLDRTAMTVAAPLVQKSYGFDLNQMAYILSAFTIAYAACQVFGAMLVDRFGARWVLTVAGLWWSICTFLTPFGGVFAGFIVIRFLLGIGQAADWPASVRVLHSWFPRSERSRGNSLLLIGLYLGAFVGTPIVAWIAQTWGWQSPFHTFAAIGAGLALLWWVIARDAPSQHRGVTSRELALINAGQEDVGQIRREKLRFTDFVGSVQFWAMGIGYAMLIMIQAFFVVWLPTYLVQARGMSFMSMGFLAALPWGAMMLTVFVASVLNDRLFVTWSQRTKVAIGGFIVAAAALAVGALTPDNAWMLVLLCVSLGAVGVVQVQVWAGCQDLGGERSATVSGFTNLCGNAAAAFGPIFTAFLVGLGKNWVTALVVMALAGLLGIVCWLFIQPDRPLQASRIANPEDAGGCESVAPERNGQ